MFSPIQHKQHQNTVSKQRTTSGYIIENNRPASLAQQYLGASQVIQRVEVPAEEAKALYDSGGKEKWREFIDLKDQGAAEKEAGMGGLGHPGEYYDYFREGSDKRRKNTAFKDFVGADAFVQSRIGKKMTAAEYIHINHLAMESTSASLKGLRDGEVSWGLPLEATSEQIGNIAGKGLGVEPDKGRYKVTVPMPKEGMQKKLDAMFNQYHAAQESARSGTESYNNIIRLYMELDALHPFKDGTARTNHLLLNKLLSEHGIGPTILKEPNSPMFTEKEFGAQVLDGVAKHKRIASEQNEGSLREWQGLRPEKKSAKIIEMEKRMGAYEEPKTRPYTPPRIDPDLHTQKIDLHELMDQSSSSSSSSTHSPSSLVPPSLPALTLEPAEEQVEDGRQAPPSSPREPVPAPMHQPGAPRSLTLADRIYLQLVMGKKKRQETEQLYADQQRRFRDRQHRNDD